MTSRKRSIRVDLGSKIFNTKSAAKLFIKNFLGNDSPSEKRSSSEIAKISDDDLKWIIPLIKRHHRYENTDNISYIGLSSTNKNGLYNTFVVVLKNGDLDYPSYHSCIDGFDPVRSMKKAMRQLIEEQINEFRTSVFKSNNKVECEICKCSLYNNSKTHIDHIVTFISLVNKFLEINNISVIETKEGTNLWDTTFIDDKLTHDWQDFHKQNAKLRPLCVKCNLSR